MATTQTANQRVLALGVSIVQRITGHQGEGRDITNPRELYAILALADVKREQTSLAAPLSLDESPRSSSEEGMNTRLANVSPRRQRRRRRLSPIRPDYHRSMELLESYRGNMPAMGLVRHSSSLEDLTRTKQYTIQDSDSDKKDTTNSQGSSLFLPEIEGRNKVSFRNSSPERQHKPVQNSRTNGLGRQKHFTAYSQNGYTEWLSETSRGLNGFQLQRSILERLRLRDLKSEKSKAIFPKLEPNKPDLRAYDKYPNQYWELRSESVHQPQDLESDMIDRDRYRLKQKSALKLKVMDQDKCERRNRDLSPPGRHDEAMVSSATKRPRQKPRPHSVARSMSEPSEYSPFSDLIIGPTSENNAPVPWTVSQDSVPPNSRKAKDRCPYFLTDEEVIKETRMDIRPGHTSQKSEIGTSVVNISIQHDTPKKRKPKHIEESLVKQKETRSCESVKEPDTTCQCSDMPEENGPWHKTDPTVGNEQYPSQVGKGKRQNDYKQKALLHGFKKIEVFGEYKQKSTSNELVLKVTDEAKKYIPRCHPPIYKLDMRNYPPQENVISMLGDNDQDTNAVNHNENAATNHDTNDDDSDKRSNSRSVKIEGGTIILKHNGNPDNSQKTIETSNKENKDVKASSLK